MRQGTWFAVPLDPGFATGILARANGPVGFGYFFGPRLDSLPDRSELSGLKPADSILACRFGLGALQDGSWSKLGTAPSWRPSDWPIPLLCRFDRLDHRYLAVRYIDDPVTPESEFPLPPGESPEIMPSDDAIGYGLIPTHLTRALG